MAGRSSLLRTPDFVLYGTVVSYLQQASKAAIKVNFLCSASATEQYPQAQHLVYQTPTCQGRP